ncbi:MAG TPA: hypothetical protein VFE34_12265 [Dongiaceae bacterium]|jgi:hypothetical protein|nr:hypothetical protein [Dongiaceae bacterium]
MSGVNGHTADRAVITLGAQMGGKDADAATDVDILALRRLLEQECPGPYSSAFNEFALVLRVDGSIDSWGRRGVDHVRLQRKLRYATADIYVPMSAWNTREVGAFRGFLAAEVESAIRVIGERVRKAKIAIDSERLLHDVQRATAQFLNEQPRGSR